MQSCSKRVGDVSVARGLEGMTFADFLDRFLMAASCNGGIGNFNVCGANRPWRRLISERTTVCNVIGRMRRGQLA